MRGAARWTAFGLAAAAVLLVALASPWGGAAAPERDAQPAEGVSGAPEASVASAARPDGAPTEDEVIRSEVAGAAADPDPAAAGNGDPTAAPTTGALVGRLEVEGDKVDPWTWEVELHGPGRRWPYGVKLAADGSFRVEALKPGSFTATALYHDMQVARVDGLVVTAGETLQDPRLDPWKPEEGMRTMRVRVAGEPGKRGDTNVWALGPRNALLGHANWVGEERVLHTGATQTPDALVYAPGYRPLRLPWKDGTVEVELADGIEVTLQPVAPVKLDEGIRRGWFELRATDPIEGVDTLAFGVQFPAADLIAGRPVTLRIPAAGNYELAFAGATADGPGFLPVFGNVVQRGLRVEDAPGQEVSVVLPDPLGNP